jgi:hypothetical protein
MLRGPSVVRMRAIDQRLAISCFREGGAMDDAGIPA